MNKECFAILVSLAFSPAFTDSCLAADPPGVRFRAIDASWFTPTASLRCGTSDTPAPATPSAPSERPSRASRPLKRRSVVRLHARASVGSALASSGQEETP
jgi:hypothetical protein